ncbi:LEA type 2 family protein [bacterium]|nr:LEA type 2 family protein [bacterium]
MNRHIPTHAVLICLSFLLFSCAELQQLAQIQRPVLDVAGVRITGLSLEKIDLAFDVDITNPNPLSVRMAGLDYDFEINHGSFLQGNQPNELLIQSNGKSRVEIPLTLEFRELYETYQAFKNMDSTDYRLACGFTFQLPILGLTRIPVQKSGRLPLIKLPKLSLRALKLNRISLTGADLDLEIDMKNPNAFSLFLKNLNYNFMVSGASWASGNLSAPASVNAKDSGLLRIPVSLDFIEMGRTVYQMVSGSKSLDYQLNGSLGFDTSLPLLKNVDWPVDMTGAVKVTR